MFGNTLYDLGKSQPQMASSRRNILLSFLYFQNEKPTNQINIHINEISTHRRDVNFRLTEQAGLLKAITDYRKAPLRVQCTLVERDLNHSEFHPQT